MEVSGPRIFIFYCKTKSYQYLTTVPVFVDSMRAGLNFRLICWSLVREDFLDGECGVSTVLGKTRPICFLFKLLPSKIELRFKTGLTIGPEILVELKDSC